MRHDPLNDAIASLKNHERTSKKECLIKPKSDVILETLKVFQENGYLKEIEAQENPKGGFIKVTLNQSINDCGVIKPRIALKNQEFTDWEKRYLPAAGFGVLVISTSKGIMSHQTAKKEGLGGRLLAYVY
ncbi:MAG: 30S ribosomal protein S8 [Candidatus Altiarchaeales archaeon]|nr:30S ribosomal protein S8 [Candidatus Altiarchaeales archaeon]